MPPKIKWTKDLETGVGEIDWQHKECIRLINALLDNQLHKGSEALTDKGFRFMKRYIREHFQLEEKLMRKSGYLAFAEHKEFHDSFKADMEKMWQQYERGADVALKLNYQLVNLFINHINTLDKGMTRHVKAEIAKKQSIAGKLKAILGAIVCG